MNPGLNLLSILEWVLLVQESLIISDWISMRDNKDTLKGRKKWSVYKYLNSKHLWSIMKWRGNAHDYFWRACSHFGGRNNGISQALLKDCLVNLHVLIYSFLEGNVLFYILLRDIFNLVVIIYNRCHFSMNCNQNPLNKIMQLVNQVKEQR